MIHRTKTPQQKPLAVLGLSYGFDTLPTPNQGTDFPGAILQNLWLTSLSGRMPYQPVRL
jgi:hypothetical protein